MNYKHFTACAAMLLASLGASAQGDLKIGFVNADRILKESAPALRAQQKLEKEFERRNADLQRMAKQVESMQAQLTREGTSLADKDRRNKERDLTELSRDLQRKDREFREDLNQRRNEELAAVVERANRVIKQYAEAERYDLIVQEAVHFSPRIDITDKILSTLSDADKK